MIWVGPQCAGLSNLALDKQDNSRYARQAPDRWASPRRLQGLLFSLFSVVFNGGVGPGALGFSFVFNGMVCHGSP